MMITSVICNLLKTKTLVSLQKKNILFKQKDYHVLWLPLFGMFGCYDGGGGHVRAVCAMGKKK